MATVLPVKPCKVQTKTLVSFDLSSMIQNLDQYEKGKFSKSGAFQVEDLEMYLQIYPNGFATVDDGYVSIFLEANAVTADRRKIEFTLKCGESTKSTGKQEARRYVTNGWGWSNAVRIEEFRDNRIITCTIEMESDDSKGSLSMKPEVPVDQRQDKMHALSAENGDIELTVELSSDDDILYSPPKKKRKLSGGDSSDEGLSVQEGDNGTTQSIRISSVILRASSPVFDQMMANAMKEKSEQRIIIRARTVKDVEDLTYFMCTGTLRDGTNVLRLLPLAHYYQMDYCVWQCCEKIIKGINIQNFVETVKVLEKYDVERGFYFVSEYGKKKISLNCRFVMISSNYHVPLGRLC